MADPASERLDRILYILPLAMRNGGATLDELATALDCSPADILADLNEVTARAFYQEPGVSDQLQIIIEGDRVEIWSPREFHQPVRLSPREGLALGLGLRILAAESPPERRGEILALARRLEQELVADVEALQIAEEIPRHYATTAWMEEVEPAEEVETAEQDTLAEGPGGEDSAAYSLGMPPARYDRSRSLEPGPQARTPRVPPSVPSLLTLDVGDDGFRAGLADAALSRLRCRVLYLKPGDAEPAWRDVAPYILVYAAGAWYVLGHDAARDAVRAFRMDRMLRVDVTDVPFEVPDEFDASAYIGAAGVYRSPEGEVEVVVRYSARVARWIEERMPVESQADGSVIARHLVADPHWIVRHVLRYGADARVLEPADMRDRVAEAALRLSA